MRFIDSHLVTTLWRLRLQLWLRLRRSRHWCEQAFLTLRTKFLNYVMIRCYAIDEFLVSERQDSYYERLTKVLSNYL